MTDTARGPLRLMCVHAHPDDESSKGAATMARYRSEGHEVLVVTCTGGERGDVLNDKLKDDPHIQRNLPEVRRQEMATAREILDVGQVWLGFVDSGLPEGDPLPPLPDGCFALEPLDVTTEALVRVIRDFRPHVMTTYDEKGGYPHPDHVMTHVVSMAAFDAAGDADRYPHAGAPWQPLKIYYNQTFSKARIQAFHDAMLAEGLTSPYDDWLKGWRDRPARHVTTKVDCARWFPVRDAALIAHATQVDPDGAWFQVPLAIQERVWPYDDFECGLSYVPVAEGEDDLFAGLGSLEEADALARRDDLTIAYDGRVPVADASPAARAADAADAAREAGPTDELDELQAHHEEDER